jgi:hypothetical protein
VSQFRKLSMADGPGGVLALPGPQVGVYAREIEDDNGRLTESRYIGSDLPVPVVMRSRPNPHRRDASDLNCSDHSTRRRRFQLLYSIDASISSHGPS